MPVWTSVIIYNQNEVFIFVMRNSGMHMLKRTDSRTTLLQQVYNSLLTWGGLHCVWGPPHVRGLLYTCCKSVVFLSFFYVKLFNLAVTNIYLEDNNYATYGLTVRSTEAFIILSTSYSFFFFSFFFLYIYIYIS